MESSKDIKKENYFLIVSRLVGTKGLPETIKAAVKLGFNLKIVGESSGLLDISQKLKKLGSNKVEFLGRVNDEKLWQLYAKAKGFIALARDEDFGMTSVEAQSSGTPFISLYGGRFNTSTFNAKISTSQNQNTIQTLINVS